MAEEGFQAVRLVEQVYQVIQGVAEGHRATVLVAVEGHQAAVLGVEVEPQL